MTKENEFPEIDENDIKKASEKVKTNQTPPKLFCEKHGEINDLYAFRVNMPEHGYENKTYCLVCAVEYLSMIASEVEFRERNEENLQ